MATFSYTGQKLGFKFVNTTYQFTPLYVLPNRPIKLLKSRGFGPIDGKGFISGTISEYVNGENKQKIVRLLREADSKLVSETYADINTGEFLFDYVDEDFSYTTLLLSDPPIVVPNVPGKSAYVYGLLGGITKIANVTTGNVILDLYDATSRKFIRTLTSDALGLFAIPGLIKDKSYDVVSRDPALTYEHAVTSRRIAV